MQYTTLKGKLSLARDTEHHTQKENKPGDI